jgi:hypothetical protein
VAAEEMTGHGADNGEQQTESQACRVDNHKASLKPSPLLKRQIIIQASSKPVRTPPRTPTRRLRLPQSPPPSDLEWRVVYRLYQTLLSPVLHL